ncbi:FAD-dependent monooxygenase [Undibacterium sp. CY18W]|uniref:FAD-dependent monooxygenase n=1 Tax=Undibacterium hunanense TaxID=2762292 RepID=A0ABR6ZRB3_9BURK|nr:FAD-dependent monooxygenase [Undibacterium hunanense]MBC3918060.1 FAD-dependent monooxygenase [Undibacterium hunanense]
MDQIINDVDIAICGAGPVGQALALLLHQQGFKADRIALFDGKTAEQAEHDARSIAVSYGSRQILESAKAWPIKATAISEIHVSRRGHFGRSLMRASDYDLPALGYVARYGDIIRPLQQAITQSGITITRPHTITAIDEMPDHVRLSLRPADSMDTQAISHISAGIVIQAEGGTFGDQQQRTQHHDYQQTAIIAHVNTDAQIAGRAFERFTEQGPLALLPQEDGYALVWCVRPKQASHLLALDDAAFRQALQTAFGNRLGNVIKTSARLSYPLGLNAQAQATARTVAIGNAAQTLHPVAGQGLNLGLRDSLVLARTMAPHTNGSAAMTDPAAALQAYLAERQADRKLTIRITDSMARAFASAPDGAFSQTLLGMGLGALDLIKPAKKMLAEQMMYGWR